jgi:hypothetical protein
LYFCSLGKQALKRLLASLFLVGLCGLPALLWAQQGDKEIQLIRSASPVLPDGVLDEAVWQKAERAGNFYRRYPVDTGYAAATTEVMMAYDDNFLYVAAICYRTSYDAPYVVESLRRDFNFGRNDHFGLYLDPFNSELNGFLFAVTPYGVQREGLIANTDQVATNWDNKWYSGAAIYADYYVVEMAIPFNTLRYAAGNQQWKANFLRNDLATNEQSSWVRVPRQLPFSSLAFTGKIHWPEAPPKPGANISLIPYAASGGYQDRQLDGSQQLHTNMRLGGDIKVGITPSLNLDVTLNPDFSQAEADQQIINLTRFDIGLPEQRQFFLENSDIFDRYGFSRIRPFFSRRIGARSPVLAGARLSGQPAPGWRTGLLMAQTDRLETNDAKSGEHTYQPGQNYLVAAAQRQLAGRSSIGMIMVNRQAIALAGPDSLEFILSDNYNRMVGVDYNLASRNNRWMGKTFLHASFNPDRQGMAHATYLSYRTQQLYLAWNHEWVSEDYQLETGFLPRRSYYRLEPNGRYSFFPNSKIINRHGPNLRADLYYDLDRQLTDRSLSLGYELSLQNTAEARVFASDQYVLLRHHFNPTNAPDTFMAAGTAYRWQTVGMRYYSDQRKAFYWSAYADGGGYYGGKLLSLSGNVGMRLQPHVQLQLRASYNQIDLPHPFVGARYFLIGPKADFTFTDKIFLSTFVQYNNQQNDLGLNTRLQWRFKPASDIFLVYTDSYQVHPGADQAVFGAKYRALIVKLSYWINV